jgi:hypothetical protein
MRAKNLLLAAGLGLGLALLWLQGLAFACPDCPSPAAQAQAGQSRASHADGRLGGAGPARENGSLVSGQAVVRISLSPSKDNTLYEDDAGALSNGAGLYLFAGRTGLTGGNLIRRGAVAFDVAGGMPPGSVVVSATLRLFLSNAPPGGGPEPVALHRLTADWGEGTSNAGNPGGAGALSTMNDATWIHRFYDTVEWTMPGGDFVLTPTATTTVGTVLGYYTWDQSPQLAADVQAWLVSPATNFGWLILGSEAAASTARRFNSREHTDAATRPALIVDFTPPYAVFLPAVLKP